MTDDLPDPTPTELQRCLDEELERTLRSGRMLTAGLLDSEQEMSPQEWCFTVLEKLRRLDAADLEMLDRLCAALLDPTGELARESVPELVTRLLSRPSPTSTEARDD